MINLRSYFSRFSHGFQVFFFVILTILQQILFLLLWNGGHRCMELTLCRAVESSCLQTHNIAPFISLHDLPCLRSTKRYWDFPNMVIFRLLLRNSGFKHGSVIVNNIFAYFTLSLNTSHVFMIKERCCFSQINFFVEYLSYRINILVSFQPTWCHLHTLIRIIFFSLWTNKHSQLETFCHTYFNRIFSNCLSQSSPAKEWPYKFRSRGKTRSSKLDHDFGHLCRGRRIQKSGHSVLGIFNNLGTSSIIPGYKQILRQLLVHRNLAIWRRHPWLLLVSFEKLIILVRWILHKILNRLSQCRLGVQLDLCIFGALPSIQHFSDDICPSVKQNELLRPSSLLPRSPLFYFWLWSGSTPKFSPYFPIPCPLLPLLRESSWLEA